MNKESTDNKYLIISSIGDYSKHDTWLSGNRLFDTMLIYYGDSLNTYNQLLATRSNEPDVKIYKRKGLKWPQFYYYISNNFIDIKKYKYIWIPDDDLEISGKEINKMFLTIEQYPDIMVAIPSTSS